MLFSRPAFAKHPDLGNPFSADEARCCPNALNVSSFLLARLLPAGHGTLQIGLVLYGQADGLGCLFGAAACMRQGKAILKLCMRTTTAARHYLLRETSVAEKRTKPLQCLSTRHLNLCSLWNSPAPDASKCPLKSACQSAYADHLPVLEGGSNRNSSATM